MLGIGGMHALEARRPLADGLPHERGALGVPRARAHRPRHARARRAVRTWRAEANSAGNVFTTHTPVPAGNDAFAPRARAPLPRAVPRRARASRDEELLGARPRRRRATRRAPFSMPVLAIRTADHYNGVSELHGEVSRKMWQGLWPDLPDARDPHRVDHQRRAHAPRGSRPRWARSSRATSARAGPSSSTTRSSGSARTRSPTPSCGRCTSTGGIASCSTRAGGCASPPSAAARGREELELADEVLDPHALTIGFARRFATYKRADAALHAISSA